MASIKNLKKDINYVLGDIIESVYTWENQTGNVNSKEGSKIVDGAFETFDTLIAKVNDKKVEDRRAQLKEVRNSLETEAIKLVEQLNKLTSK